MIKVTKASAPELEGVRTEPATPPCQPTSARCLPSPPPQSPLLQTSGSISPSDVVHPSLIPLQSLTTLLISPLSSDFYTSCIHTRRLPPPRCLGAIQEWFTARRTEIPDSLGNGNESLCCRGKVLLSPAALGLASTSSSELPTQRPVLFCTAAATAPRAPGAPRGPR